MTRAARLLLLLLLPCLLLSQERNNIAVYEFDARGLSVIEAQSVTDRIRLEMSRSGSYSVIEREMMEQILLEQDFQLTGACSESSCLVQVGELLAVHFMIGGSVTKIGNLYTIEARMIDIETGQIANSVIEDYVGPIENLLVHTTRVVAGKLAGLDVDAASLLFTGSSDLLVRSNPPGGTIYLEDKPVGDVTPFRLQGLQEGQHTVVVRKGNLVGETVVTLSRLEMKEITVDLALEEFVLRIYSDPEDAEVLVNGRQMGRTPLDYTVTDTTLDYIVELKKDLHITALDTLHFGEYNMLRASYNLVPCGRITLPEDPSVHVYLDDIDISNYSHAHTLRGRWIVDQLDFGEYAVRLEKENHQPFETQVSLTSRNPANNVEPVFTRLQGKLALEGTNYQVNGLIAGGDIQETFQIAPNDKVSLSLPYGNYTLVARAKGHFRYRNTIQVYSAGPQSIQLAFRSPSREKATIGSFIYPGLGQIYSLQYVKGIILAATMTATVAWLNQTNTSYGEELERYNGFSEAYVNASNIEEMNQYRTLMNDSNAQLLEDRNHFLFGIGLATVTYLFNMVDITVLYPYKETSTNISLNSLIIDRNYGLTLQVSTSF